MPKNIAEDESRIIVRNTGIDTVIWDWLKTCGKELVFDLLVTIVCLHTREHMCGFSDCKLRLKVSDIHMIIIKFR